MSESNPPDSVFLSLPDRIRALAALRPNHPALIQDERIVTYGELDQAMDRIAASLQRADFKPQDVIAICALNSIAYVEVFCGALRAGVVTAPLAPSATAESLVSMIADCGAKLVFVDEAMGAHLAPLRQQIAAPWISLDAADIGTPLGKWMAVQGAVPVPVVAFSCAGGDSFGTSVNSSRVRLAGFGTPEAANSSSGFKVRKSATLTRRWIWRCWRILASSCRTRVKNSSCAR